MLRINITDIKEVISLNNIENYVYKKEVDWSLLHEGLTLPVDYQVVFGQTMNRFLKRGESKIITLLLDGTSYKAKITNVNYNNRFNRIKDTLQIRYPRNGDLARKLQVYFSKSYNYISNKREIRAKNDRSMIKLPEEYKEYLAIYSTEYDDTYVLETIVADELYAFKESVIGQTELLMEASLNYGEVDNTAKLINLEKTVRIRKLNKKIGDNLKLLYNYQCQICGEEVGKNYDTHVVESHHIDYFVNSVNNDSSNQMIICPNHHRVIHNIDPLFDRRRLSFIYPNGYVDKLAVNKHL